MQTEYEAIHAAGHLVQIDCPDLGVGGHSKWQKMPLQDFRDQRRLHVEALNRATANIPPDRLRMHFCFGNYEGPHHYDASIAEVAKDVFHLARPKYFLIEGANPRHAHEVDDFRSLEIRLPDEKVIVPGVIDTKTNYIEHPRLIAKRLKEWVEAIGNPDRVMAGSDCGFGTFDDIQTPFPDISWAKLRSLHDGARLASQELGLIDPNSRV